MANLILVGVDGSDTSMAAGRKAAELAVALKSKLYVLTAFHSSETESYQDGTDTITVSPADSAEAISNRAADELRTIAPHVEAGILYEKAGDALLEEAKRLDASLIVMGNRNMQGFKRVLGSVPNRVSHNAPCDVYIVNTV